MAEVDLVDARVTFRAIPVRSTRFVWIESACFTRELKQSLGYVVELQEALMNNVLASWYWDRAECVVKLEARIVMRNVMRCFEEIASIFFFLFPSLITLYVSHL